MASLDSRLGSTNQISLSHQVARRYHAGQPAANVSAQIDDQLNQLLPICRAAVDGGAPDDARLRHISDQVEEIVAYVQKQLPAPN